MNSIIEKAIVAFKRVKPNREPDGYWLRDSTVILHAPPAVPGVKGWTFFSVSSDGSVTETNPIRSGLRAADMQKL